MANSAYSNAGILRIIFKFKVENAHIYLKNKVVSRKKNTEEVIACVCIFLLFEERNVFFSLILRWLDKREMLTLNSLNWRRRPFPFKIEVHLKTESFFTSIWAQATRFSYIIHSATNNVPTWAVITYQNLKSINVVCTIQY